MPIERQLHHSSRTLLQLVLRLQRRWIDPLRLCRSFDQHLRWHLPIFDWQLHHPHRQPWRMSEQRILPTGGHCTTTTKIYSNVAFRSYTMLEASNETLTKNQARKFNETHDIRSSFSCLHRPDGYYESEWCNIFHRCINGKRLDARCPSASVNPSMGTYDLWWRHQNAVFNASHPHYFGGHDYLVRCDWPCKVECTKPIWVSKEDPQGSAEKILKQDQEQRPGCSPIVKLERLNTNMRPVDPHRWSCTRTSPIHRTIRARWICKASKFAWAIKNTATSSTNVSMANWSVRTFASILNTTIKSMTAWRTRAIQSPACLNDDSPIRVRTWRLKRYQRLTSKQSKFAASIQVDTNVSPMAFTPIRCSATCSTLVRDALDEPSNADKPAPMVSTTAFRPLIWTRRAARNSPRIRVQHCSTIKNSSSCQWCSNHPPSLHAAVKDSFLSLIWALNTVTCLRGVPKDMVNRKYSNVSHPYQVLTSVLLTCRDAPAHHAQLVHVLDNPRRTIPVSWQWRCDRRSLVLANENNSPWPAPCWRTVTSLWALTFKPHSRVHSDWRVSIPIRTIAMSSTTVTKQVNYRRSSAPPCRIDINYGGAIRTNKVDPM